MPVILTVTVAAAGGWLLLWVWLVFRTSPVPAPEGMAGIAGMAGTESPAVLSLLAGRLTAFGYQATLLDLAARGWFRMEAQPDGPVMCVLGGNPPPPGELVSYERRAYSHLVTRAGGRRDVPAEALADGFAGEAGAGGGLASAKDGFMEGFVRDVTEDARQRGLSRPRVSSPAGCLLFLTALVPAIASALTVHACRSSDYWIPVACFFGLCALLGLSDGEQPTPAGRAALRDWRARCATPAVAIPAMMSAGRGAGIMPPDWPREVAYAAAMGRAPAAVGLFTGKPGQQRGKAIWSSYGGAWRQITIGDPARRSWVQAGGCVLQIVVILLLALLPPTVATIILAHGVLRAAAFGVVAFDALLVMVLLGKDATVPGFAEFDGQVVEAWTEEESDENTTSTRLCVAIDDGVRDQAWAFSVTPEQYGRFIPGTLVHARVNPRRNKLLEMWPLSARRGTPG